MFSRPWEPLVFTRVTVTRIRSPALTTPGWPSSSRDMAVEDSTNTFGPSTTGGSGSGVGMGSGVGVALGSFPSVMFTNRVKSCCISVPWTSVPVTYTVTG